MKRSKEITPEEAERNLQNGLLAIATQLKDKPNAEIWEFLGRWNADPDSAIIVLQHSSRMGKEK